MTREIEYRAYWKSKKIIRDVVDIYFGKKQEVQSVRVLCEHDGMSYPSDDIYVDDFILMQYTGLKDRNGVKIFEGDVVLHSTSYKNTYVVSFKNGSFIASHTNTSDSRKICPLMFDRVEVISNIHEDKK